MKFTNQPALYIEAIKLLILCGIAFGLKVTEGQLIAIIAALGGLGALIVQGSTVTNKALSDAGIHSDVKDAIAKSKL